MASRYSITTEEHGFANYDVYSDVTLAGDLETAVIARIVVEHGPYINSVTVFHLAHPYNLGAHLRVCKGALCQRRATSSQTRRGWAQCG